MRRKILLSESQLIQLSEAMSETTGYHGGKTQFDRFSNSFAHSGEGVNTQGFGVYIALDRDNVAYYYATYEQTIEHRHFTLYVNGIPMKGASEGGNSNGLRPDFPNRDGYNEYNNIKITQSEQEYIYWIINDFRKSQQQPEVGVRNKDLMSFITNIINKADEIKKQVIDSIKNDKTETPWSHILNINNTQWVESIVQTVVESQLDGEKNRSISIETYRDVLNALHQFHDEDVFELPSNKYFEQYLYTVDVPDVNKENYLDWDGRIDDEITWDDEFVDSYREFIKENGYFSPKKFFGYFGTELVQTNTVKNLYDYITEMFYDGDEEKTSNYFASHGKKGSLL